MASFSFSHLLGLLIFASTAVGGQFNFSIQEIYVLTPRALDTDDLLFVIASHVGSNNKSDTWHIGDVHKKTTIDWNNISQQISVPASAPNLSVAIGGFDEQGSDQGLQFVEAITGIAASVPGPQAIAAGIFDTILNAIGDLFNCSGPTVVDNIVYANTTLNNMTQNQTICDKKNYTYPPPHLACGTGVSNYTVTFCLQRLDAKNSASYIHAGLMSNLLLLPLMGAAFTML